ncbi:MAG: methylmalonyl-CoA mutase small subunit [Cyclobacteriaceae bacterium]|nr:methylmalonyl-CoA mutase small subunit [Cyclobacteriaceae bacterium]
MSKPAEPQALFSEFDEKSKNDWIDLAIEDLRGADFSKKLVWNTQDGISVDPFYTLQDIGDLEYLKKYHNALPVSPENSVSPRSWHYMEMISSGNEKKANAMAHEALHMGADGIVFYLPDPGNQDPALLVNELNPHVNPVIFHATFLPDHFTGSYVNLFSRIQAFPIEDISGGLNFDPLREYSLSGNLDNAGIEGLSVLIRETENMPGFRVVTVNGSHFLNSGSDTVHEIAFCLNSMVEYLDRFTEMGIPLQEIIRNLRFSLAAGTNYFMEIAKLKAFRILFTHILETYGITKVRPQDLQIHCDTSLWTKTIYDPHVNLLRNTTEAMAAVLGGTNSLTILPFDVVFSKSNGFSRRISRNISNLLKEESYFNKVVDPAAGSYYIEMLTDKLIERSLDVFKETEAEGGYVAAFEKGMIQKKIADSRDRKYALVSSRRKVVVGTNQYANPAEKVNPGEIEWADIDFTLSGKHLIPARASYQFERLRLNTDQFAAEYGEEKRPKVFLSLVGDNKVMRKARATFAHGFFGCAGFRISESSPSSSLFESVQKAIDSNSDLVVMCGSDEDYIENGADFAKAFKANQPGILVVAGNPAEVRDTLLAAGVEEFIHIKTEVIESLRQFQIKLNIIKA